MLWMQVSSRPIEPGAVLMVVAMVVLVEGQCGSKNGVER